MPRNELAIKSNIKEIISRVMAMLFFFWKGFYIVREGMEGHPSQHVNFYALQNNYQMELVSLE